MRITPTVFPQDEPGFFRLQKEHRAAKDLLERAEELLSEWVRLGKSKQEGGLAIHPHLLRLRDATEAWLRR